MPMDSEFGKSRKGSSAPRDDANSWVTAMAEPSTQWLSLRQQLDTARQQEADIIAAISICFESGRPPSAAELEAFRKSRQDIDAIKHRMDRFVEQHVR